MSLVPVATVISPPTVPALVVESVTVSVRVIGSVSEAFAAAKVSLPVPPILRLAPVSTAVLLKALEKVVLLFTFIR